MPKVSIIIPTYNREKYLPLALDSILNQTFKDYEIIVIDDGSTDNTRQAIKPYEEKIQYLYQDNAGVSAARNAGIRQAKGEWLAFLDSDDEWVPDYLFIQMETARKHSRIYMQTTDAFVIALNGEAESYYKIHGTFPEFKKKDYLYIEKPFTFILKYGACQTAATIIRHEAVIKAGLFDTSLERTEDYDLMARVALQGPLGMIRKGLVNVYRRNEKTECLTHQCAVNPIAYRESNERIFEKLKRIDTLTHKERKTVNGSLSANRRTIGNLLLQNGDRKGAKDCFKQALFIDPSIASLSKYILSFLPAKTNLWIMERKLYLKTKK
jgi:glycosyltransferase involved in cell wall biosynthesis